MSDERDIIAEAISDHLSAAEHAHKTHFDAAGDVLAALSAAGLRLTPVAQHEALATDAQLAASITGIASMLEAGASISGKGYGEKLRLAAQRLERMARDIERLSKLATTKGALGILEVQMRKNQELQARIREIEDGTTHAAGIDTEEK